MIDARTRPLTPPPPPPRPPELQQLLLATDDIDEFLQQLALWVPGTLRTSCDLLIFVDQAAEAVASNNLVKLRRGVLGKGS